MADYVSILSKAIEGLSENNRDSREKIYTKARAAIDRQLRALEPMPSENAIGVQLAKLEDAINEIEAEQADELVTALDELETLEPVVAAVEPVEAPVAVEASDPDTIEEANNLSEGPVETKSAVQEEPQPPALEVSEPSPVVADELGAEAEPTPEIKSVPEIPAGFIEDIDLIDGIGPKTAQNLRAAGVINISQIAIMDDATLEELAINVAKKDIEKKQEWKAQAFEMLSGELPRAKSDQERLKKLRNLLPVSAGGKLKTPRGFIEDVSLIDGIGAKTAEVLSEAGVTSITQIAAMPNLELAAITERMKKPGLEFKQEWKAQAVAMLSGKQPRAKSDQDRLKKLRAENPIPDPLTPDDDFVEDVVLIDGIGEKTALALNAVGVTKISQIAKMSGEELADATRQIGIPGFELTQEWNAQAVAMVKGELPRARNDRDKLLELKSQNAASVVDEPIVEVVAVEPEVAIPASEPLPEIDVTTPSIEVEEVPKEDEESSFAAALEELASETANSEDVPEEINVETRVPELETTEALADQVEPEMGAADLASNAVASVEEDVVAPVEDMPELPSEESELTIDDILAEMDDNAITSDVDDLQVSNTIGEPTLDDVPSIDQQSPVELGEVAPEADFIASPETAQIADPGVADLAEDLNKVPLASAPLKAGLGRMLGCAGLLVLLGGSCAAAWMNRDLVADYSNKGKAYIQNLIGFSPDTVKAIPEVKVETTTEVKVEVPVIEEKIEENMIALETETVVPNAGESLPKEEVVTLQPVIEEVIQPIEEALAPEQLVENEVPLAEILPVEPAQPVVETVQVEPVVEPAPETQPVVVEPVQEAVVEPVQDEATPAVQESQPIEITGETALLYEEAGVGGNATRIKGGVNWSVKQESPSDGFPAEATIHGVVDVPERDISMTLTIKRNVDAALPASHVIEILFDPKPGFEGRNIGDVSRFVMKTTEQARGEGLIGVPAKIADGFFFIALNNLQQAKTTNERLLQNSDWIDIPVVYTTGQRGLVTMNKGVSGQQAFADAFADWRNR